MGTVSDKKKGVSQKALYVEEALQQGRARLSRDGALVVETGHHTGRQPQCRYIARSQTTEEKIAWGGNNQPIDSDVAQDLINRLQERVQKSKTRYRYSGFVAGFPLEATTVSPWHAAFIDNMFRETPVASVQKVLSADEKITIWHDPAVTPAELGVTLPTDAAVVLDPATLTIAVAGTAYAGEVKKAAFTLCNYRLPDYGFLSMHASANCRADGKDSCVLFGLSGTGKTTLSSAPDRYLVGDDEIVWTPGGLSNLEGGCYAKLIDLTREREPEIFDAVNQFGAILENVVMDSQTRTVDFSDRSKTENTRGSYNLSALEKVVDQDVEVPAPKNIVFLVADAFGSLPPVAKLDSWQAQYHFISGYTAKVAGTEVGVTEPQAVFSACFGAPFMPRHVSVYSKLLVEYAEKYGASVWLLNTGWMKGGYGKADRFPLEVSRSLLRAIQSGEIDTLPRELHPIFGFEVPTEIPGLEPDQIPDPSGENVVALARKFQENIQQVIGDLDPQIISRGGPKLEAL